MSRFQPRKPRNLKMRRLIAGTPDFASEKGRADFSSDEHDEVIVDEAQSSRSLSPKQRWMRGCRYAKTCGKSEQIHRSTFEAG
jgi:hypothetical protein